MRYNVLLTGLFVFAAAVAIAQDAPDMFKDMPKGHWAYMTCEKLRKVGVLDGYPDRYFLGKYALTRYEFAVAADRTLQIIKRRSDAGKRTTDEQAALVRRLTNEFRIELASMGITHEQTTVTINQAQGLPGFKDVPPDHWAYPAVERLRQKGILRGYPDGSFQGVVQKSQTGRIHGR